jgi:hypothetical protein
MSPEYEIAGEIFVGDNWIELIWGESVYKLDLDERGLPVFPESLKQELPRYVPGLVEQMLGQMKIINTNHSFIGIRESQRKENTMSTKLPTGKLLVGYKSVEFMLGGSIFKLDLDDRGLPVFPESVKEKVPPYIPQLVQMKMGITRTRDIDEEGNYLWHAIWCDEIRSRGTCNCNPVCRNAKPSINLMSCGYGTLTCVVCKNSATGEMILESVKHDDHEVWETIYTRVDERYWICSELICNPCLFGIMRNIDVEFVEDAECNTTAIHE